MYTREALELGQDQIVTITTEGAAVISFDGTPADGKRYHVNWDAAAAKKGGFPNFMTKEIHDQPVAVADTLLGRTDEAGRLVLDELRMDEAELRAVDKIVFIACGTAAYAGMVAKYALEHWTRIPCEVELASEFRYRDPVVNEAGRRFDLGRLPIFGRAGHDLGKACTPAFGRFNEVFKAI